jgi:hypothetical protein
VTPGSLHVWNANIVGYSGNAATGIEFGAVPEGECINCNVSLYDIGINVDQGQSPVNSVPLNVSIVGGTFLNNDQENTASILHPGIYVHPGAAASLNLNISGITCKDTQATPTQLYCVVLAAGSSTTLDYINVVGNSMSAYSGGSSIGLSNVTVGSHAVVNCNTNYTQGSGPANGSC